MTLQTFIVPLVAVAIGTRNGTCASLLYILLGVAGLPVFAGMRGGVEALLGPTGGFIFSFSVMALITGLGYDVASRVNSGIKKQAVFHAVFALGQLLGVCVNYLVGMIWYSYVTGNSMKGAFFTCVAPFILMSVIKIVLVSVTGPVMRRSMVKAGILEFGARC